MNPLAPTPASDYTPSTQVAAKALGARSSAGEHLVDIEGVTGSIPVAPTI